MELSKNGLDVFAKAFEDFSDCYVVIGGTVCDIILTDTVRIVFMRLYVSVQYAQIKTVRICIERLIKAV